MFKWNSLGDLALKFLDGNPAERPIVHIILLNAWHLEPFQRCHPSISVISYAVMHIWYMQFDAIFVEDGFWIYMHLLWTLISKLGCHYSCTSHATIECRKANGFKNELKKKWVVFVSFGFSSCFWEAFLLSENQTYARRSLQNGFFPPSAQDSQDILSKTSPSVT